MKKSYLFLIAPILLSSCANVSRSISSQSLTPPDLTNLLEASQVILTDVEDHNFPNICTSYLKELENKLDVLDMKKLPSDQLAKDSETIAKNSWAIRSILHSRLNEFSKDCVFQIQSNFRQFRFIEDYLLEINRKLSHLTPADIDFQNQPVPILDIKPNFYQLRLNGDFKFEPGDLLITRGVSFLSAMIARLGQRSTQFSHVVMVYDDQEMNEMRTIESYVGVGVSTYDLKFALKNENARILWLRAKDKNLAREAAQKMSSLVKERIAAKDHIKYDYELNFDDPTTMSCAEVSQVAFQMADPNFKIPFYPNEISGAKSIIERLKIQEGPTYEPGDMEIDPRFELVGEFQDLRLTRDSRQKDAILTAIFNWMSNKDYYLQDNLKSKMAGGIIHKVRKTFLWPLVKKILKLDDFSKEIPSNMLRTVTLIGDLGETMLVKLKERDIAHEKATGLPMNYMEMYQALEEFRVLDLDLYNNKKTRKQAKIHKLIRPKK